MGRHRKFPVDGGKVVKESAMGSRSPKESVMERLGLRNSICQSCNANNPQDAHKCRKCGATELRPKRTRYADAK